MQANLLSPDMLAIIFVLGASWHEHPHAFKGNFDTANMQNIMLQNISIK